MTDKVRKAFEKEYPMVCVHLNYDKETDLYYLKDIGGYPSQENYWNTKYIVFKSGYKASETENLEKLDIALEALIDCDATICSLCRVINPQHRDCTSCDEKDFLLEVIAILEDK